MIFTEFSIKNFRGIKTTQINGLSRVNLFLGRNNCGKTTVLEAIFVSLAPTNPGSIVQIDNLRNLLHDEENDFRFVFYGFDYNNTIEINSKLLSERSATEHTRELKINPIKGSHFTQHLPSTPDNNKSSQPITSQNSSSTTSGSTSSGFPFQEFVVGLQFEQTIKKYQSEKKKYKTSIKLIRNQGGLPSFQFGASETTAKENFLGIFQQPSSKPSFDLNQRLSKIIVEKKTKELLLPLKEIDSKIVDLHFGVKNMLYFDTGIDQLVPSNLMGDGFLRLLEICVNIYSVKGGVLLIDEVDNGLHFSTLRLLWKTIFTTARRYDCQVFVTSHNFELIEHLAELLKEDEYSEFKNDMSCYTLIKDSRDKIISTKYDFEKLEFAINKDIEVRDAN